jgi:hypothetical protein
MIAVAFLSSDILAGTSPAGDAICWLLAGVGGFGGSPRWWELARELSREDIRVVMNRDGCEIEKRENGLVDEGGKKRREVL